MKNETMQEQYEDALFSLMMKQVAERHGEQAYEENERLNADPAFAVPAELEERCLKLIRSQTAKQSGSNTKQVIKMTLYRAAAVACIAIALFVTAFAASSRLQTAAINFLVREFDECTTFYFTDHVSVSNAPRVTVPWRPEGFELTGHEQNLSHTILTYQNEVGAFIRIYISDENGSITIDNENAESSTVTINDHTAIYTDDGMMKSLVWGIDDLSLTVYITGAGIEESDLLQMATELRVAR